MAASQTAFAQSQLTINSTEQEASSANAQVNFVINIPERLTIHSLNNTLTATANTQDVLVVFANKTEHKQALAEQNLVFNNNQAFTLVSP